MKRLIFPKGPQGPIGATLGTAMNNFYSSPNKVSTHYNFTILLLDLEKKMFEICMIWPSPWAPMGATHTILTTLNPLPLRMIPAKFG